jgi:LysM repeat protein
VSVLKRTLLILILAVIAVSITIAKAKNTPNYTTYIISKGDTLWSIASRFYPGSHTGKAVYEIRKLNNIDDPGSIQPGQTIIVWVPDKR